MSEDNPQLTVEIHLDDGTVKKGVLNVQKTLNEAGKDSGGKFFGSMEGSANSSFDFIKGKFLALAATIGAGFTISKAISEAAEEEEATSRLNAALRMSRQYTEEASNSLNDFASEMQRTTRYSDDTILSTMAFIEQLAKLDTKGLKRATQASADLATALRIDLQSASMLVSKAAEGNITMFQRYGIQVKQGATNSLTFANALTAIEQKFGGLSKMDLSSFSGMMDYLKNMTKNLLGEFGNFVVKSPAIIAAIKIIGETLESFAERLNGISSSKSSMKEFSENILSIGNSAVFVAGGLELFFNSIVNGWKFAVFCASTYYSFALKIQALAVKALPQGNEYRKEIELLADVAQSVTDEKNIDLMKSFQNTFSFPMTAALEKLAIKWVELTQKIQKEKEKIANTSITGGIPEKTNAQIDNEEQEAETSEIAKEHSRTAASISNVYENMGNSVSMSFQRLAVNSRAFSRKIADTLRDTMVNGAGQAFASFGKAIAEGDNALKAMAESFIGTLGQMCVQMGTMFIAQGVGMMFSANPVWQAQAPGLIAAGAALAVLGGAMSAFGSGGSSASSSSGSAASSGASYESSNGSTASSDSSSSQEKEKKITQITVNVQGDILDGDESGLRMVELIKNSMSTSGVSFA